MYKRWFKGLIYAGILTIMAVVSPMLAEAKSIASATSSVEEEIGAVAPTIEPGNELKGNSLVVEAAEQLDEVSLAIGPVEELDETSIAMIPQAPATAVRLEMAAVQEDEVGSPAIHVADASLSPQEPGRISDLKPSALAKSATALTTRPTPQPTAENSSETETGTAAPLEVSQAVDLGGSTQGGASYLGIAANVGIAGNSSDLGRTSFTVISKLGLTNTISFRPTLMFNQTSTILLPITFDFPIQGVEAADRSFRISPFVGGGAVINTGSDTRVGGLITAGLDVPINREFTAVAAVNVGFLRNTDVGLILGIAYNFNFLR
ncbi:MAG: hypothetical protein SFW36_15135 [Leptolyngbyaceae cyanobacterium bins.59]|nr:hypothetical protein [Leptolyngbyaceae cyanobacterium bins.59]